MRVALVFPPLCDPTAPYIALPVLAAVLRDRGHEVLMVDANLEAARAVLSWTFAERARMRIEHRLAKLEKEPVLNHRNAVRYAALWKGRGEGLNLAARLESVVELLTGKRSGFYTNERYAEAVALAERAMALQSAAWAPLAMDFRQYRTPLAMMDRASIERDAEPARNPFSGFFTGIAERIKEWGAECVSLTVAFPGQLLPSQIMAARLREVMPDVLLLGGGPAISQFFFGMPGDAIREGLGPFDAVVAGDGDEALPRIVEALARGDRAQGFLFEEQRADMTRQPCPDFEGLPLEDYLSPKLVLPYDLARGCYWGRCAFCHYGTVPGGTAPYRVRDPAVAAAHLVELKARYGAAVFYLSEDALFPAHAREFARNLRGKDVRWSTDLRPEHGFTASLAREMVAGGLLSVSVGIESASPRTLVRMDKGIDHDVMRTAVHHLAEAGIAVEAMAFEGFPGESARDALLTLRFLAEEYENFSLFIYGQFGLVRGSRICASPADYGINEIWSVAGDRFESGLFWSGKARAYTDQEFAQIESALEDLSAGYRLAQYPWAGSLSTAHTQLRYLADGPRAFACQADLPSAPARTRESRVFPARFDVGHVIERSEDGEAEIWEMMVADERAVSLARYRQLAGDFALIREHPGKWCVSPGYPPVKA